LANITGDDLKHRDLVVEKDGIEKLLESVNNFKHSLPILKSATWAISNISRGKPYPAWKKAQQFLPLLNQIIQETPCQVTLSSALWSLSYLSGM